MNSEFTELLIMCMLLSLEGLGSVRFCECPQECFYREHLEDF